MKKLLLFVFACLVSIGTSFAQTDIYVSQYAGDNRNDGSSWATPYSSLKQAFLQVGTNQDTFNIYVSQGNYLLEGNDGPLSNEIQLNTGQVVNILGGYSTPTQSGVVSNDPEIFSTNIDTADQSGRSAFRLYGNADLALQDLTIVNARLGGDRDGAFVTLDDTDGSDFSMENVNVNEWEGGSGTLGRGFIYVYRAQNTNITVKNSLIQRLENRWGVGKFLDTDVDGATDHITVLIEDSIFRNIRGGGTRGSIIDIEVNCRNDEFASTITLRRNQFINIKKEKQSGAAPAVLEAEGLYKTTIEDCFFYGNRGGSGIIEYKNAGILESSGNLFQDNYTGNTGGVFWVRGEYICSRTSEDNQVTFTNDTFISNFAGTTVGSGRGGAIAIVDGSAGGGPVNKPVTISGSKFYDNIGRSSNGGAVYVDTRQPLLVENSIFCNNSANPTTPGNSQGSGGAMYVGGESEFKVSNSVFRDNFANIDGGAIKSVRVDQMIVDNCSYFENNVSRIGSGGAIWARRSLSIDSSVFENNNNDPLDASARYGDQGGAIAVYGQGAGNNNRKLELSNSWFVGNKVSNDGGAIHARDFYISTDNVVFDSNDAGRNGGAVDVNSTGTNQIELINSRYISNNAERNGGAIHTLVGTVPLNIINNNEFLTNNANTRGGAIAVSNTSQAGDEIDVIDSNKFFGNTYQGDANNKDYNRRSDIYLANAANLFNVNIGALTNNSLQFEATSANYKNGSFGTGYRLGAGNNKQTVALSSDYNITCTPESCPVKEETPVAPLVLSAEGDDVNAGVIGSYTSYTEVAIAQNADCTPNKTEVAFSARSNEAIDENGEIIPTPIPELNIYYKVIKANNLTNVVENPASVGQINVNNASRVEETSDEIPLTNPRDLYKTYYLDVTADLQAGYTYSYVITKVERLASNGSVEETFDFPNGNYYTTLVTEFCDSDADGLPNYVESGDGTTDPLADSDNDGTPDYLDSDASGFEDENGDGVDDNFDTDGDGQPDFLDLDSDNDGILDSEEAGENPSEPIDTDGDGQPDFQDLDSDNDGINDVDEGNPDAVDADADGMVDGPYGDNGLADSLENDDTFDATVTQPIDTNNDGTPNYQDLDSDGDGTPDSIDTDPYGNGEVPQSQDPTADSDGNGVVDDTTDIDNDGIMDSVDSDTDAFGEAADTDGDGIPDNVEVGPDPNNPVDTDSDGIPDYQDLDSDNDGIPDSEEAGDNPATPVDTDGDGVPDYQDLDSDNDGINDIEEAGGTDVDGDGQVDDFEDTDGDGLHDPLDNQDPSVPTGNTPVNNGTPLPIPDTDNDGTPDYQDLDSNNDGVFDVVDSDIPTADADGDGVVDDTTDTDGDGIPDSVDGAPDTFGDAPMDTDGDGIPDEEEGYDPTNPTNSTDTDGDGIPDYQDLDSDNDGILDTEEAGNDPENPVDTDGDGIPDYQDLDSDNDSINDVDEGNPDATDNDGDGMVDGPFGDNGLADSLESDDTYNATVTEPTDTDNDGIPDYQDLDSDNDNTPDSVDTDPYGNGEVPRSQDPSADVNNDGVVDDNTDVDNDGIMDSVDSDTTVFGEAPDTDGDGISDEEEGYDPTNPTDSVDTDGDGVPDYRDLDSDNDGISDAVEQNNAPSNGDTDGDGVPDYRDLDSDNDGFNDIDETDQTDSNEDGQVDEIAANDVDGDGFYDPVDNEAIPGTENDPTQVDNNTPANTDPDNDGTIEYITVDPNPDSDATDTNGDGFPDGTDTDGDGIIDVNDGMPDTWGDSGLYADLSPNIEVLPSQVVGLSQELSVRIVIEEVANVATDGSDIFVTLPESNLFSDLVYDETLNTINNLPVLNSEWSYLGLINSRYVWKYNANNNIIEESGTTGFGFNVNFDTNNSAGNEVMRVLIFRGSGGDKNVSNDFDTETINYSLNN